MKKLIGSAIVLVTILVFSSTSLASSKSGNLVLKDLETGAIIVGEDTLQNPSTRAVQHLGLGYWNYGTQISGLYNRSTYSYYQSHKGRGFSKAKRGSQYDTDIKPQDNLTDARITNDKKYTGEVWYQNLDVK